MSVFARFPPRLQQAIATRLGWSSLRPVQEEAGEALLAGKNAVILAPTAGGKTEASIFPTLAQLIEDQPERVGALYIAPIKALLNNQAERLGQYTEMVALRRFVWHGDVGPSQRKRFLREPCELLMTTPESLEVMLISKTVDAGALFADLRTVIIDEVHAVAGTDRGAHLMSVLERLARLSRHDVQRVGLSATVGNPNAILTWLQGSSQRAGAVVNPPKPRSKRELLVLRRIDLEALSADAAELALGKKSLLFCQSRSVTEAVAGHMRRRGTEVFVHHSAVSQEGRAEAEERFHTGTNACIVCTSTLELGIDVGDLDRVLQANSPDTVSSFLQRMGRTGRRAGQAANTTFLCESAEAVLQAIALIELAKRGWIEHVDVQNRCWPVLVHQLFALALATEGITRQQAWDSLQGAPDFSGFERDEFERLLTWLVSENALADVGGQLVLGEKAERTFGRRNFMELFAVFSSPVSYRVQTSAGAPVGTLSQEFVDRLAEGVSTFLLGGRAWLPLSIQHNDRIIQVGPAPRGRQPTWGGYLPQFLGFDVCQQILSILRSEEIYPYLHESARESLAESRAEFSGVLRSDGGGFEIRQGEILWWTFAGGRINSTLRYLLQGLDPLLVASSDNFAVRVKRASVNHLLELVARLQQEETWHDEELWSQVVGSLPTYRLSKFQPFLPAVAQREMLQSYLLDVGGTKRWVMTAGVLGQRRGQAPAKEIGEWSGLAKRIVELEASIDIPVTRDEAELPDDERVHALEKLVRQWVAEALVTTHSTKEAKPSAGDSARWMGVAAKAAAGYTHQRLGDSDSNHGWEPKESGADYIRRLIATALNMARAPMDPGFEGTRYPPEDLDGLEDFLLVLFDLAEQQDQGEIGRIDRSNLARAAAQLIEPFCAKLLSVLEQEAFLEELEGYEKKGRARLVGLQTLLQLLRKTERASLSKQFFTLLSKRPATPEGWETLDTFSNSLRDLYFLRNRFGHRAPVLSEEEVAHAAWHSIVVILTLVEGNLVDLKRGGL